jgi:hypothetical protein
MLLLRRLLRPFASLFQRRQTLAQRLDARLPDLAGVGPVLFSAQGLRQGVLSAHQRLQTAEVPAIVDELLGPHGHLMVAPDGIVAWRGRAAGSRGEAAHWEMFASQALPTWTPGHPVPDLARDAAFRVRGRATSLLGA